MIALWLGYATYRTSLGNRGMRPDGLTEWFRRRANWSTVQRSELGLLRGRCEGGSLTVVPQKGLACHFALQSQIAFSSCG